MKRALLAMVLGSAPALAQGPNPHDVPGVWRKAGELTVRPQFWKEKPATTAQVGAMRQQLLSIVEALHTMPAFAKPMGAIVEARYGVSGNELGWQMQRSWPLAGRADVEILEYYLDGAKLRTDGSGYDLGLTVRVNDLSCVFNQSPYATDGEGPIYAGPPVFTMRDGRPHTGSCTVLTKSSEPLYAPVTRERAVKLQIARLDSSLKEPLAMLPHLSGEGRANVSKTIENTRARQAKLRQLLATWTPEQKNAPAMLDFSAFDDAFAARPDSPTAAALVEPNRRLFDHARAADVQLITVGDLPDNYWGKLITPQINWASLRSFLK